jgi:hypothetical protein
LKIRRPMSKERKVAPATIPRHPHRFFRFAGETGADSRAGGASSNSSMEDRGIRTDPLIFN